MKKQSHARYYQNLLHRYLGFKPKLTVLSTRDSDFLYHRETIQQPTLPTSLEQGSVESCHLGAQSRFDEDSRRKHLVHLQSEHLVRNKLAQDGLEVLDK